MAQSFKYECLAEKGKSGLIFDDLDSEANVTAAILYS
jgi:hypothetical protein